MDSNILQLKYYHNKYLKDNKHIYIAFFLLEQNILIYIFFQYIIQKVVSNLGFEI